MSLSKGSQLEEARVLAQAEQSVVSVRELSQGSCTEIDVHHAETHLSKLIAAVERGRSIIARNGKPASELIIDAPKKQAARGPSAPEKKIWMADDWHSPETNQDTAHVQ